MQRRDDALLALARQVVRQHGMASLTAAATAAGVLVSQGLTALAMFAWGADDWGFALFVSTMMPLLLLPPISWTLFGLVYRLHLADDKLQRLAQSDSLTGVANRRHFTQLARNAMLMAHRYKHPLALVLIDIDGLKRINDEHGPLAGDDAMAAVARLCQGALRDSDIFARFAGDEFVAALPHADAEAAAATAERLRRLVENSPVRAEGASIALTVTLGVAATPLEHEATLQDLFGLADDALRRAKVKGGNRVETLLWEPKAPRPGG